MSHRREVTTRMPGRIRECMYHLAGLEAPELAAVGAALADMRRGLADDDTLATLAEHEPHTPETLRLAYTYLTGYTPGREPST